MRDEPLDEPKLYTELGLGWASGLYRDRDWDLKRVFAVFEEAWVKTMADNRADNSNS